jgi:hypothetical protein
LPECPLNHPPACSRTGPRRSPLFLNGIEIGDTFTTGGDGVIFRTAIDSALRVAWASANASHLFSTSRGGWTQSRRAGRARIRPSELPPRLPLNSVVQAGAAEAGGAGCAQACAAVLVSHAALPPQPRRPLCRKPASPGGAFPEWTRATGSARWTYQKRSVHRDTPYRSHRYVSR